MSQTQEFLEVAFSIPDTETFTYTHSEERTVMPGCRVQAQFGRRNLTGYVIESSAKRPAGGFEIKSVEKVLDTEPIFGEDLLELARWVSGMYMCSLGEALSVMIPGGRKESSLGIEIGESMASTDRLTLSKDQEHARRTVMESEAGLFYLYGITGSGKTEVFLRIAEETLTAGRSVIYLVPEIALTHQLIGGLEGRFGSALAIIHSKLTPSQKLTEWRRIIQGDARFVVGARSAVFAPVADLGLIIIDEEHEGSYKSGSTPRYHARQVAMRRRSACRARLVMGSATPSVEAYHLMGKGVITRLNLTERLSGGAMPEIQVVDMKGEKGALSKKLLEGIRDAAREKRQVILFLNRRGFSYFFHCRSCGFEMKCRQCAVSLTYHKSRGRLICHYCGYSARPINQCPDCGSVDVGYSGFGTELIEEEVSRQFPELSICRIDTDSVKKKGALQKSLDDFKSGKIDILLGTQMVAKGLNFPGVRLVGIVLADTGLHLPDFRSQERTFALIVQVSGRAGRYIPDGKVIIQTYRPENDAIRLAAAADMPTFYERELAIREVLSFPPFSRILRIVFRGAAAAKVIKASESAAGSLSTILPGSADILGPAECPLSVIAGKTRYQLIIRTKDFSSAHAALGEYLRTSKPSSGVYREIDIDPVSLL